MKLLERFEKLAEHERKLQDGSEAPKFWTEILYPGQEFDSIKGQLESELDSLANQLAETSGKDLELSMDFWDLFSFTRDFVCRYSFFRRQQLAGLRSKLQQYQYLMHERNYVKGD